MAVTSTEIEDLGAIGNNRGKRISITTTGNYATGGYAIAVTGMSRINLLLPEQAGGCLWRFDPDTQKLLAYYFDYDAGADGVGIQYANATALAVTLQALVLGE